MRTLGEIIDECKAGEVPTADEMRYAICAMDALITFDGMSLRKLVEQEREKKLQKFVWSPIFQYEQRFHRLKRALNKDPKTWVGPENDPDDKGVQERRRVSQKIVNSVLAEAGGKAESLWGGGNSNQENAK